MHLRLQTWITISITVVVMALVGVSSWLYLAALTSEVIREADNRAGLASKLTFLQAQDALAETAGEGQKPASSAPEDVTNYVRQSLDGNAALGTLIDAEVGYSFLVYEVTVVDSNGTALISSDASLVGHPAVARQPSPAIWSMRVSAPVVDHLLPPQAYRFRILLHLVRPAARCPLATSAWPCRRA